MCQFKSGIILKDRVFIPDYDSHTDMLQKLKIEDTEENARRLFVRAELIPPNNDVFAPVSSWKYCVDQDILPEWYVAEVDERRMREAVTEWAKEHIHIDEKIKEINSGTHWIKDGEIGKICGSADIRNICGSAEVGGICGSAKVGNIFGSAEVGNICDSANIRNIYGSAKVGDICDFAEVGGICGSAKVGNIFGSAKVGNIYDSAEVGEIYDSATATIPGLVNWEHTKSVCIKDNAVLIDRYNKKIYHSGAFETVIAGGKRK